MGGKRIELTPTVGEALLDTGIFDKIRFAKEQGLVVAFYTNGTLL